MASDQDDDLGVPVDRLLEAWTEDYMNSPWEKAIFRDVVFVISDFSASMASLSSPVSIWWISFKVFK